MGKIHTDIMSAVGATPLVRLNTLTSGLETTVLAKVESMNPLGSVKDRIGVAMIQSCGKGRPDQSQYLDRRTYQRQYRHCPGLCLRRQEVSPGLDHA